MSKFEVLRLPLMSSDGQWMRVASNQWAASLDKKGLFKLRHRDVGHVLSLGDLLAIEVGDEAQVTAVGKTLGRMALTGVGAALFTQGRGGSVGAGLLDLSLRGAEKKSVISGLMIFLDSSIMKFKVSAEEFDTIVKSVSQHVFSAEALQDASEMFDLLRRMKADGERVLHEILSSLIEAKSQMNTLAISSEIGQSFAERDAARQELAAAEHNYQRERFLFTALLYDIGVSPQQFSSNHEYPIDVINILPNARHDEKRGDSTQNIEDTEVTEHKRIWRLRDWEVWSFLLLVLYVLSA